MVRIAINFQSLVSRIVLVVICVYVINNYIIVSSVTVRKIVQFPSFSSSSLFFFSVRVLAFRDDCAFLKTTSLSRTRTRLHVSSSPYLDTWDLSCDVLRD